MLPSLLVLDPYRSSTISGTRPPHTNGGPLPNGRNVGVSLSFSQQINDAHCSRLSGDVVSFSLMGQRIVILNSLESAIDLLEKKSTIYSDRQPLPVTGKILKWDQFMGFTQYGHRFREMRRYMHRYIGSRGQLSKVAPLYGLIEEETQQFLVRLLKRPEQFAEHIQE